MIEKVYNYMKQFNMLGGYEHIIVGLSGGADSVCLLTVLKEIVEKYKIQTKIYAIHINHMIRGKEAYRDEAFSRETAERLGVEFVGVERDVTALSKQMGISLEDAGRRARYEEFGKLAKEVSGIASSKCVIAVAHHKNDQAETVLMHMIRGAGLKGMSGMAPVSGNVIRPLLCVDRKEIENFLANRGIRYVTDSTNESCDYSRNRLRNRLIPYVEQEINPDFVGNVCDMARNLSEAEDFVSYIVDDLYSGNVLEDVQENGKMSVKLILDDAFLKAHRYVQKRVILKMLNYGQESGKDIYSVHVDAVFSLIHNETGKTVCLPAGVLVTKKYDCLLMEKNVCADKLVFANMKMEKDFYDIEVEIPEVGQAAVIVRPDFKVYAGNEKPLENVWVEISVFENDGTVTDFKNNDCTKYFNYDIIKDKLLFRGRRDSDYIFINKGNGKKLLSKELVDKKVELSYRNSVLVVAQDDCVLWAYNVRRCDNFLIDESTNNILKISIMEGHGDEGTQD